jgi:hypothetical protein
MPDAYHDVPRFLEVCAAAIEAMKAGRYAEAAPQLEWAAMFAFGVNDVMQVKLMGANAVKAYAQSGDAANAVRLATRIVDLFHGAGRNPEIPGFAKHALADLRTQGHPQAADALSAHISGVMGGAWSDPDAPKLPAFCSSCGAAVKPAEIVRPTPSTVACHYCGASLDRR